MSEREIENYIALVSSMLRLSRSQRDEIGSELRDHLETRVDALLKAGHARDKAMQLALEEFGDAAGLAVQFVSVVHQHRRRWMMRFATLSVVGMFLVLVLTFAMWPKDANFGGPGKTVAQDTENNAITVLDTKQVPDNKSKQDSKPRVSPVYARYRASTEKIEKALNEVTELNYSDSEFRRVINEIQQAHDIPIYVQTSAKDAGLDDEELVSIKMKGVPLRDALTFFLQDFDCTYVVKGGFLVIADSQDCPFAVRTFNCQEILGFAQPGLGELALNAGKAQSGGRGGGGFGGGGAGGGGGFGGRGTGGGGRPMMTPEQVAQDRLTQLIEEMVSPDSWESADGEGSLRFVGDILVVRQRGPELHQIGQVLDDLLNEFKLANAWSDGKPSKDPKKITPPPADSFKESTALDLIK
jgi:uncharacterized membrane protein YgcG